MKKIEFLQTQKYPDHVGGAEIFDYYMILHLSKELPVEYISYSRWKNISIPSKIIPKIKPLGLFTPLFIFSILFCERKDISFIHMRFSRSKAINWWPFPILNKFFGIKYIIGIHGGGLTAWKCPFLYKALFNNAAYIYGISDRICQEYEKRLGKKIWHIPPLIPFIKTSENKNSLRQKHKIAEDAYVLLFVGSLKPLKRPTIILEACSKLCNSYLEKSKILILFVGDGPLKEILAKQAKNLNLERYTRFEGIVPREKINQYYKIADLYIISSDFEGTPLSMLEAMFNGIPIVAANSPGINNIIEDGKNGLLFDNKSATALPKCIEKLILFPDFALKLAHNAECYFNKNYDYQIVLNKIKGFLSEF